MGRVQSPVQRPHIRRQVSGGGAAHDTRAVPTQGAVWWRSWLDGAFLVRACDVGQWGIASASLALPPHPQMAGQQPRSLVILPYLSIVQEKAEHLEKILAGLGMSVRGYVGQAGESRTPLAPG